MGISYNPKIVTDGLVLCLDAANRKSYPGSGTTWTDLSGRNNTSTLENGAVYDSANQGSIYFDGTNDRVLINCVSNTVRAYNSTTHFIIRLPLYSGGQRNILSYRTQNSLYIGKASNGIFVYYNTLSPDPAFTVGNIASNTVAIVAVTCDASNNLLSTYINGNLIGSVTKTGWSTTYNSTMYLGYDGGTNEYMIGNFYNFMHYNKVLTASEIQQNFQALRGRYGI
jgi:hypothetical protein